MFFVSSYSERVNGITLTHCKKNADIEKSQFGIDESRLLTTICRGSNEERTYVDV